MASPMSRRVGTKRGIKDSFRELYEMFGLRDEAHSDNVGRAEAVNRKFN